MWMISMWRLPAQRADTLGVNLVWSNPCFEIWLILHKSDCSGFIESAKKANEKLVACLKGFDKSSLDFSDFRDGIEDAIRRAKALGSAPASNPSTDVWRLVEALRRVES
jgi:hypothetical protein